ncbi:MAG: phosphatidate cytidylyltransferase [Prevotellaceae bacterium]|jgi:phosphatidate cytidylyltransferase|nr:phosphatidate cytidylyltransferase [Prevotellaceae bacterium]
MSNFVQRTISGAIFISIVIASILLHVYTFLAVFVVLCAWSVREFQQLTNKLPDVNVNTWAAAFGGALSFLCSYVYASDIFTYQWIYSLYIAYVAIVFIAELFRKAPNPVNNWAYFILGQIYVALPFSLLNFILFAAGYNPVILLSVFIIIWVNDTVAYLFGVTMGKRRLFERISPKKSWEGFIGGALGTLATGYVFSLLIPELSLLHWLILAEIIIVFGTFGDLTESLLKRTLNVKDSGDAIPGHGGLLDRFDSMLLAAPAVFVYLTILFN